MSWQPLKRSTPTRNGVKIDIGDEEQWANGVYVVYKRQTRPGFIHLSIKRADRQPCRDWRDFQRIKNQLAGPEWEAVELYPAESRLVDMANQFHLWCFEQPLGLGWQQRLVGNQAQADLTSPGAVQRDPEAVDLQYGGLTNLKDMKAGIDQHYGKEIE